MKLKATHHIDNWSLRYNYSDEWLWNIKKTEKSIVFTMISNWCYDEDEDDAPSKITYNKRCKHAISDWEDWSYTLYMNWDWQPIHFYPII